MNLRTCLLLAFASSAVAKFDFDFVKGTAADTDSTPDDTDSSFLPSGWCGWDRDPRSPLTTSRLRVNPHTPHTTARQATAAAAGTKRERSTGDRASWGSRRPELCGPASAPCAARPCQTNLPPQPQRGADSQLQHRDQPD
jgi:hypothetical protein